MDLIVDFPHVQSNRRVTFVETIDVKFVEDLSFEYKPELWFTHLELRCFQHRTKQLVAAIQSSNTMTMASFAEMNVEDTSAFMGLECYLTDAMPLKIASRRKAVVRAVMSEQERQRRACVYDPDEMAHVSLPVTELARKRASIIGLLHTDKRGNQCEASV